MGTLISRLQHDYPSLSFQKDTEARWSFADKTVFYTLNTGQEATWTLLHELGHALLGHASYASDVELLQKEVAAWEKARELARRYAIRIEETYAENCLDTYRDWLHRRSACPECSLQGIQQSSALYDCFNCQTTWKVTEQRFCRPYRLKMAHDIQRAPGH